MKTINAATLGEFLNFRTLEYLRSKNLIPVTVENIGKVNHFIFNLEGSSSKCIQMNTAHTGFSKLLDTPIVCFTDGTSAQRPRYAMSISGIHSVFNELGQLIKQTDACGKEFDVKWFKKKDGWKKLRTAEGVDDVWYKYDIDYRLVEAHTLADHFTVEYVKGEVIKEKFLDSDGDVTFERLWQNTTRHGVMVMEKDFATDETSMHTIRHYI